MGLLMKEATEMSEYEYLEQRRLHIKVGLVSCKHQHVNQTASRVKHSEDFTLPNNSNNPCWLLTNYEPRVPAGIYMMQTDILVIQSPDAENRDGSWHTGLVYLPFNHVMWQLVQEGITEFSHSESFRLYIIITNLVQMY